MIITGKALDSSEPLFEQLSISPPVACDGEITLGKLISHVVCEIVAGASATEHAQRFIRALTASETELNAKRSVLKTSSDTGCGQRLNVDQATAIVLKAFVNGLFLIVVDRAEQRELHKPVQLRPTSEMMFIRLVLLSGG